LKVSRDESFVSVQSPYSTLMLSPYSVKILKENGESTVASYPSDLIKLGAVLMFFSENPELNLTVKGTNMKFQIKEGKVKVLLLRKETFLNSALLCYRKEEKFYPQPEEIMKAIGSLIKNLQVPVSKCLIATQKGLIVLREYEEVFFSLSELESKLLEEFCMGLHESVNVKELSFVKKEKGFEIYLEDKKVAEGNPFDRWKIRFYLNHVRGNL